MFLIAATSAIVTGSALAVPQLPASDPTLLTALVRSVNSDRMFTDLDFLSNGLKTRSSATPQFDTACQYALDAFRSMGLSASLDPFSGYGHPMTNVVAVKTGTVYPSQIVIIGAHLDSTSPSPATLAPGAEDNGSGSVAVLEAARLLASLPSERTIHFILFGGEEQDMLGSAHYAAEAASRNLDIRAVLTMDMIGYNNPKGADLWIEGFHRGTSSAWLMSQLDVNARTYGGLKTYIYPGEGSESDHISFHDHGFPAVLAAENECDTYACWHETCDTVDRLDAGLMRKIAGSVVATAAELAGVTIALAQINGTVRVAGGGSPAGAIVALAGTSWPPITVGASGQFAFPNLLPAAYTVTVFMAGSPINSVAVAVPAGSITTVSPTLNAGPPFGAFDTPVDGATGLTGSFLVSGWALDDTGVTRVEIWRDPVVGEATTPYYGPGQPGHGKIFIATPLFVTGSRPDVESAYGGYPQSNRAGWGYLLLSWGLWNRGNGTYKLYAYAYDTQGNAALLGARTIGVDNAHATKPFGALDTPSYGATVSEGFWNYGWALTPNASPPCAVTNGQVLMNIDSGPFVAVNYGDLRTDIAASFPGFSNGNTAGGAYYVDTTQYGNGMHQIGWLVTDNCGRQDGIGSRFFTIQHGSADAAEQPKPRPAGGLARREAGADASSPNRPARSNRDPVGVRHFGADWKWVWPAEDGWCLIEVEQTGRIEVQLPQLASGRYTGYQNLFGQRRDLPLGSSVGPATGIFYWQPGPGFLGTFDLVFDVPGGPPVRVRVLVR